ncbi:unnamed protein product [Dracunculus medinensis]|uniref:BH4_AAA_HYDROXYL_2 domain-containing protein n=1 Tax=Dracunculus medinensis TaxID=318479 RepID=A0A0N4UQ95_DRAME|nr:unnamed protein product [Dracunculus medinensis]
MQFIRLDEEVKAIGGRQDESENAKKYLIEVSTSFRENTDKTIRKAALPLIRAFQSEVDRLTLQNKTIETVIIDICRSLTQLPGIFSISLPGNKCYILL